MMTSAWAAFREGILVVIRQRGFRLAIFIAAVATIVAALMSEWTMEDPRRVFFNCIALVLECAGAIGAIAIGLRLSSGDRESSRRLGMLALPVSRSVWCASRSAVIFAACGLFSVLCLAWLSGTMVLFDLGVLENPHRVSLLFLTLFWALLGHVALVLGELFSAGLAGTLTVALWIAGEIGAPMSGMVAPGDHISWLQRGFHLVWQVDRLLLFESTTSPVGAGLPRLPELAARAGHALGLCALCLLVFTQLSRRSRLGGGPAGV